jgi:hypothetical protein
MSVTRKSPPPVCVISDPSLPCRRGIPNFAPCAGAGSKFQTTAGLIAQRTKVTHSRVATPRKTSLSPSPFSAMFAGIVSSVKAEQQKMAHSPRLTTVSGITRNLNPEQPQHAECPMCVTPEEIHQPRQSPDSRRKCSSRSSPYSKEWSLASDPNNSGRPHLQLSSRLRELCATAAQCPKTECPNLVTLEEIVTCCRSEHS